MHRALLMAAVLVAAPGAYAQSAQEQLHAYLTQRIHDEVNNHFPNYQDLKLNIRLAPAAKSLPVCDTPLHSQTQVDNPIGALSWWVECQDKWRLKANTQTSIKLKVATAARLLKKGHRLQSQDIQLQQQTLLKGTHLFYSLQPLLGKKLRRTIRAQEMISDKHIKLDYQVARAHQVTIVYQGKSFAIETAGVALENGVLGDRIQVRTEESGALLSVVVIGKNRVQRL